MTNKTNYEREYIDNNKLSIGCTSEDLVNSYDQMYNKVKNMINTQTTYSTWIRVQFGNNNPITFNTSSTNKTENIIAGLEIKQSGANAANMFTLKLIYDPFDYGQNTTEKVQGLDDIVGQAIAYDATSDKAAISGWIQYGYNFTEDNEIVSPKFKFILINAESSIDFATGMATYTFEGTSVLALDCDFDNVTYEAIESTSWNLMDLVAWVLYYYYGDPENPPNSIQPGVGVYANSPKYKIDIPKEYFEQVENITYDIRTNMTPWQYCLEVLNSGDNIYTKKDLESGKYENVNDSSKLPSWKLYITDYDNTIHLVHVSPLLTENDDIDNMYMQSIITWGDKQGKNNLVTKWDSGIDLKLYLIQNWNKARTLGISLQNAEQDYTSAQNQYNAAYSKLAQLRQEYDEYIEYVKNDTTVQNILPGQVLLNNFKGNYTSPSQLVNDNTHKLEEYTKHIQSAQAEIDKAVAELEKLSNNMTEKAQVAENARDVYQKHIDQYEPFDAEMQLVGVPAIAPVGMRIRIIPRVAENRVSRQAGTYIVTECSDSINTNGTFITNLKLYKLRDLVEGEY